MLERALRTVAGKHPARLVTVRLSGLVHTDDIQALKHTALQLCSQQKLSYSRTASFEDNMVFLHDMLTYAYAPPLTPRPAHAVSDAHCDCGCPPRSECARAHRAVVFVLDEFDLLALRPKQTLLYTILNAMHSAQVQSVVLGVSCRMDAAELLEKRVLRCVASAPPWWYVDRGELQMQMQSLHRLAGQGGKKRAEGEGSARTGGSDGTPTQIRHLPSWLSGGAHSPARGATTGGISPAVGVTDTRLPTPADLNEAQGEPLGN